ncbi:unnamed protein product, partial [Brassica oleracea]
SSCTNIKYRYGWLHTQTIQHRSHVTPTVGPGISSTWREPPKMKVARKNPVAGIVDGKIYVMGGCKADETKNWAEVFNPNTQTWESLPDPGPRLLC